MTLPHDKRMKKAPKLSYRRKSVSIFTQKYLFLMSLTANVDTDFRRYDKKT